MTYLTVLVYCSYGYKKEKSESLQTIGFEIKEKV